jgi:hypothetical protein
VQPTDFTRFRAVLAGLSELYQRELSGTLLDAYWLALRDWTLPDFEAAAASLMASATFMPRPADFNALRKASQTTGAEVWQHVLANCARWRYGQAGDGDPAIDAALRAIGGNQRVAMCHIDKLPFLEKRFLEIFDERREATAARLNFDRLSSEGAETVRIGNFGLAPAAQGRAVIEPRIPLRAVPPEAT